MSFQTIQTNQHDAILTITLNRPEKLNALNRQTIDELHEAFSAAKSNSSVRVVILTGAGPKAFVAGADIAELDQLTPIQALEFSRHGQDLMLKIERLRKPTIAAINGFALGGGMELAMACTFRFAANTAKFGQPEINLGIIPGFGGTQRLLRLAGRNAALELCLTGSTINAERALALNAVTRVTEAESLMDETLKFAQQLAAAAPHAIAGMMDCILIGGELGIEAGLDYESQAFAACAATDDKREGTKAFIEKRKAVFVGK